MKKMHRTVMLLVALAALACPAVVAAQPTSVHDALTGGLIDRGATTLYLEPPRAGMVMVYRDGKPVSWLTRPGFVSLSPNRIYGVVATRGSTMLFNARYRLGPGLTQIRWSNGNVPSVAYQPSARRPPPRVAVRPPRAQGPRGEAASRRRATAQRGTLERNQPAMKRKRVPRLSRHAGDRPQLKKRPVLTKRPAAKESGAQRDEPERAATKRADRSAKLGPRLPMRRVE